MNIHPTDTCPTLLENKANPTWVSKPAAGVGTAGSSVHLTSVTLVSR
jgi:hypothetical protein